MENKKNSSEQIMKLKESSHLLAEVLYSDGVDIYKRSSDEMQELEPTIVNTRLRIDSILKEHFQTSFSGLDKLPPKDLHKIRESFLKHYRGSIEKAERLKKMVPLNQLVGYTEVLVASAYLQLNIEIDVDIKKNTSADSAKSTPLEHLRIKILNAFKKVNQGKKWEDVRQEVERYLKVASIDNTDELTEKWRTTFEAINYPLQELYAEHVETMQINDAIYDLQFREEKRSAIIHNLVGKARRSWKPADLQHDIHSQSTEVNRSIIELTCNAIDANIADENKVDVSINKSGYSVRDHGSGMNPYVILEKLMIPKVSGKTGTETIGRFGVGFYTVLSHLKRKNDIVRIETHDGKMGHVIEFKIHERTGDIFIHTERNDELEKGTNISVQAEDFDSQDAEKLCRELLVYNDHSDIILNGEKMNNAKGYEDIKGEHTSIRYTAEIADNSKVSLMVNGVVIEHFDISGMNVCKEMAIDFPLTCSLPESRSELSIDSTAINSINEIIDTILVSKISKQQKISICNVLYPVLEKLQARTRSNKQGDNLIIHLQEAFKGSAEMKNSVFLPNTRAFQILNIPNALYLDSRIHATNLEKIPGITKCDNFESSDDYQLFIVDFKENTEEFVVEDGKRLVIDRKAYEQHKNCPIALNTYFSNLDSTNQSRRERIKGRMAPNKKLKTETTKSNEVSKHDDGTIINKEILDVFSTTRISDTHSQDPMEFINSSEDEQIRRIEESVNIYKDIKKDGEYIKHTKSEEIKKKLVLFLRNYNNEDLDIINNICLEEHADVAYDEFLTDLYIKGRLLKKNIELVKEVIDLKKLFSERETEGYIVHQQNFIDLNQTLELFDKLYDTRELIKEFSEYTKNVLLNFIIFIMNIRIKIPIESRDLVENVKPESKEKFEKNKKMYTRAKEIFLLKIAKLSLSEQQTLIKELTANPNYNEDPIILALEGQYHNIPRTIRGHIMYIVEGGEILNEKSFEDTNIEEEKYQAQISLSILVQAKKDNEQFFQEFSGTSPELATYAKESQKGVDPSKALRDIMHSTENQIVNDGYLWIREILQNSLDAVKQNRTQLTKTPKVSINTYLRKDVNEKPKNQQPETATNTKFDLVVEVHDPVGMDLHTVINYLLIPNESSKKYDEETTGKFGQGFFTIFGDAKEVLIKTSRGNLRTEYIKIKPIKDQSEKIIDFSVEMSWKVEEFKGTVIQKVINTDMPQVEAAFCKSAVVSYGGLIDRSAVQLDFLNQEINTPRTILAETLIPELGMMRIYDAHENAMTQNGLYIKELDEELLAMIPTSLRDTMQKNGMALDIPASIKLIKSRADIAKKKEIIPLLAEHVPTLVLRSFLSSIILGKAEVPNIPYDYFESLRNRQVGIDIVSDAKKISSGVALPNYEKYLNNENAIAQLLTLLPCINIEGERISIFELADKFSEDPNSIDVETLPKTIKEKIILVLNSKSQEKENSRRAEVEYGTKNTMIMEDTGLPNDTELKKIASAYYAYDKIVKYIFEHTDATAVQPKYYMEIGQSEAHAYQGTDSIGFNLDYLEKQIPQLAEIIEQKLPATDEKVQKFLEKTMILCTHERQHNLEGSGENKWTHNDTFFEGQRQVIKKFVKDQSINIQEVLDEIYQKFTSSFVPAKRLVEKIQ